MTTPDRRKHARAPLRVDIDLRSGANFYSPTTRDLSEGGLFVHGPAPAPIGQSIHLHLSLLGKKYEVAGEVAWILEDEAGDPTGFGVRFVHLPRAARRAIVGFMARRVPIPFVLLDEDALDEEPETVPTGTAPARERAAACPPPLPWTPSCPPAAA